ncbi:MAG: beta-N-acetylhexosaminidase [Myxococcales bacterium]|nr:beta-N-acetylhexosaminidase [Myxococcales bacterium]
MNFVSTPPTPHSHEPSASNNHRQTREIASLFCFGFVGTEPTPWIEQFLRDWQGAGYILFRRNMESAADLRSLNERLWKLAGAMRPLALVDQEGGPVLRLGDRGSPVPAMAEVGRTQDPRIARAFGRLLGHEVRAVGFSVNCAPVLDVHTHPHNPIIGRRAFSTDPHWVGVMGEALLLGLHDAGVLACAKHFPGHGDTALDSHLDLPVVSADRKRLYEVELAPFRHVLARRDPGMVMTAHVLYPSLDPELPATLSPHVLTILRKELAYDGVVVTDDLEMQAVSDRYTMEQVVEYGLRAGVDLFLICHDETKQRLAIEAAIRLVESGVVSKERIANSVRRIARIRSSLRGRVVPDEPTMRSLLRSPDHLALMDKLAHRDAAG